MNTLIEQHNKENSRIHHLAARVIAMVVCAVVFGFSLVQVVLNIEVESVNYQESGGINYQVCLKQNDYFSDACLSKDRQYVASIINDIKADFNYQFSANDKLDLSYDYEIVAKTVANEKDSAKKVLYENEEVLLKKVTETKKNTSSLSISNSLDIDYTKYNSLITAFRNDYVLNLDASLVVTMRVNVNGTHPEFDQLLNAHQDISITIPLSERTINVQLGTKDVNNAGSIEQVSRNVLANLVWYTLLLASLAGFVYLVILSIIVLVSRSRAQSDYDRELHHIIKEYNQLIVEADTIPKIHRSQVVMVHSFDELLDARETIQKPIVHVVIEEDSSLFVIEDSEMSYAYILSGKYKNGAKKNGTAAPRKKTNLVD